MTKDIQTIQGQMRGPVYPVLPAFKADHSLDLDATRAYVDYLNQSDVRTLMVTAGTSRFNLLSKAEIADLNRAVLEANDGKAVVITANPMIGSTSDAVAFTQEMEDAGADAILIYYPERYYHDDGVYDYYAEIAKNTRIGVMIHANPMRRAAGGQAFFSVDLCKRLIEHPNFIGMKEEHGNPDHRYKLATHLGDRLTFIVAGRSMRMFVGSYLFGIQGYLVGVGSLKPQIEEDFYTALMTNEFKTALRAVREYEEPFFDVSTDMGWHIAMKGALALMELIPVHERPPLQSARPEEVEKLRAVLSTFQWI